MSNKNNNNDSLFSNQDTIVRREWINSALEGVRARLGSGLDTGAVDGNVDGINIDTNDSAPASEESRQPAKASRGSSQRGLYVAWSAQERRSGT